MENEVVSRVDNASASSPTLKYVHLEGRVQIGYIADPATLTDPAAEKPGPALVLTPLDANFEPIPGIRPILVYLHTDDVVKVEHINVVAEFNREGFEANLETIRLLSPNVGDWDDLEASSDSPDMNPSGPPKSRP